ASGVTDHVGRLGVRIDLPDADKFEVPVVKQFHGFRRAERGVTGRVQAHDPALLDREGRFLARGESLASEGFEGHGGSLAEPCGRRVGKNVQEGFGRAVNCAYVRRRPATAFTTAQNRAKSLSSR